MATRRRPPPTSTLWATPSLQESSMIYSTTPQHHHNTTTTPQIKTTDQEWTNVATVLTGLRKQNLASTPANGRYAKQTTDTDIWAWKQTSDWGNRKTIRKFLDKIDLDRAARAIAAHVKHGRTTNNTINNTINNNNNNRMKRPSSAPMKRDRSTDNPTKNKSLRTIRSQSRPQTATVRRDRPNPTTPKTRRPLNATVLQQRPSGSHETKRNTSQTAGEWVISLAQGKSLPSPIRKKYGISRRRKTRFARVNHKDVLTLERVAFRKQQRKERLVRAQQQFERINFL